MEGAVHGLEALLPTLPDLQGSVECLITTPTLLNSAVSRVRKASWLPPSGEERPIIECLPCS